MHYRSSSDYLADSLMGLILSVMIILIILEIYLAVKALNLIVRTFTSYPKNKALWITLVPAILLTFFALLFQKEPVLSTLAGISILALLITCKAVEIYYMEVFMKEPNMKEFLYDVKHPLQWWESE